MIFLVTANLITLLAAVFLAVKLYSVRHDIKKQNRLIGHMNIGYYRYRYTDGVILEANQAFLDIIEIDSTPENIKGKSLSELIIYEDSEGNLREQVKARGQLRNFEYNFRTLQGNKKAVRHNSFFSRDRYSGEEVIEGLVEDITAEKRNFEKMNQARQRYEKLFKFSGDMVMIHEPEKLKVEEVNPVVMATTGYAAEEIIDMPLGQMIHPSRRKELKNAEKDLMFKGNAGLETRMVCKNGTYKEVLMTMSICDIENKKVVMSITKDISAFAKERKEEQKRRRELEDFCKAAAEREKRIKDLKAQLESLRQRASELEREEE